MSNSNSAALALTLGSPESGEKQMENMNSNLSLLPSHQIQTSSHGPVAILWDIENCPIPSDVRPEDVAGNIRMALRVHPVIDGAVTLFSAYGDFNSFPRRLREGCQRTGVKLVDVPNGRKDAADKAILVDMFLFALDNHPPSTIMLISGDVDFAPALHILGQRGYTIILVIPPGVGVSSALCNAGRFVWDWHSVVHGEGFVPPAKTLVLPRTGPAEISGFLMGCQINDNLDGQNEEEAIVYRGISKTYYNTRDFSQSLPGPSHPISLRSSNVPPGMYDVPKGTSGSSDQNDLTWVQPGDINGLKGQLVKLLELSGGCMPLTRLPSEYQKIYGRPLYVSEYGALKLVSLLSKMADAISVEGRGQRKSVCIRNLRSGPNAPFILAKKDKKGKKTNGNNTENAVGTGSSDDFSDEERIVVEGHVNKKEEQSDAGNMVRAEVLDQNLKNFKYELQEILVSYSCRIFLGCFEDIYQQRYKRSLDYVSFGVKDLEELLGKVGDIAVLQVEPLFQRKFLVAVGG